MAYKNYKHPPEFYFPETPEFWGDRKQEYARLYKVYQQRMARLEKGGHTHHDAYRLNKKLPKPGAVGSSDVALALGDLRQFLDNPTSTVTGLKKDVALHVSRLRDSGFNFVNSKNYWEFVDFMEFWRQNHAIEWDSEKVAQLFGESQKKGIPPDEVKEHFSEFMKNQRELGQLPKITDHGKPAGADAYRKALAIEKGKATRLKNRMSRQAADKGIDVRDLDDKYWKKNILALEHQESRPGWTAADYKRQISSERRAATRARNARRKR